MLDYTHKYYPFLRIYHPIIKVDCSTDHVLIRGRKHQIIKQGESGADISAYYYKDEGGLLDIDSKYRFRGVQVFSGAYAHGAIAPPKTQYTYYNRMPAEICEQSAYPNHERIDGLVFRPFINDSTYPYAHHQEITKILIGTAHDMEFPGVFANHENLTHLTIMPYIPKSIDSLPRLTITKEIAKLKHLKSIFIQDCLIDSLPEEFGELSNLEHLHLNDCGMKKIPESFSKLTQLKTLYIDDGHFTQLPEDMSAMKNLEQLELEYCAITDQKELDKLLTLKKLCFFYGTLRKDVQCPD